MLIGFRQRKFRSCRVVRRRKSGGWTGDSSSEELSNIFTQAQDSVGAWCRDPSGDVLTLPSPIPLSLQDFRVSYPAVIALLPVPVLTAPQQPRQAGETEEQLRLNYLSLVEPPPDYEVLYSAAALAVLQLPVRADAALL